MAFPPIERISVYCATQQKCRRRAVDWISPYPRAAACRHELLLAQRHFARIMMQEKPLTVKHARQQRSTRECSWAESQNRLQFAEEAWKPHGSPLHDATRVELSSVRGSAKGHIGAGATGPKLRPHKGRQESASGSPTRQAAGETAAHKPFAFRGLKLPRGWEYSPLRRRAGGR